MDKKNLEKLEKIKSKGKLNYIIRYGILGWGIPTGVLVILLDYIRNKPQVLIDFLIESIPTLIVFPLFGIIFGLIMFKNIRNKIERNK